MKFEAPLSRFLSPAGLIAVVLIALACIGATTESPACRVASVSATRQSSEALQWQAASHAEALNISSWNLQMPRAPRHRSDRPTSSVDDVEVIKTAEVAALIGEDDHRPFVIAGVCGCPLDGHPLSLLRPPSLPAG